MTLQRYLTGLIALCVVPVLALAAALGYLQFSQARDDDHVEAQRVATGLAREIEGVLGSRAAALQMLSRSPLATDPARWPELYREAQGYFAGFGGHVAVLDADLRPRLHTHRPYGDPLPARPPEAVARSAREALQSSAQRVTDPYVGDVSRQRSVAIATPGRLSNGGVYVLGGTVPVDRLAAILDGVTLPAEQVVSLYDSHGGLIARGGAPSTEADHARAERFLRFTAATVSVPWTVEVRLPRTTYLQHLASEASAIAAAVLGATAISLLGAAWAARRLTRSVRWLVEPAPGPPPGGGIEEIRQARALLDDSFAQREAASLSLRLREEQLRGIFESASEAIVTADARQRIVLANPAAARIFGRPLEAMIGAPLDHLIPERFRARHHDDVERFGGGESGARVMSGRPDVVGLRADGSEFPVEAAISQVHLGSERLYTVILRDVSERRRTEAIVAAARARLEASIESMGDGLLLTDGEGRVVALNTAFARMYGFADKADCPGTLAAFERILEIRSLEGEVVPSDQWGSARALRGETGTGVERWLRRRDTGSSWIASITFAPIRDAAGGVLGSVVSVRDVTAQKALEEELRTSHADMARLMAAQQTVEEQERRRIARELHDELQQVLAAIKMDVGAIEAVLDAEPRRVPPLLTRIDDLATAAIVSSRRIVNDLRPLLLEELGLQPALEALGRQFAERSGLRVEVDARHGGEAPPDAIAICLYRAAQEALNNVAKHAGARRVQVVLAARDGGWRLSVSDDGRGLRPEDRRKPMSFGLRGMVERVRALGGTLRVEGAPGRGVTVVVEIGTVAAPHALA